VYVSCFRYPACNAHAPYCHLWPARLYKIFQHYLSNVTIFEKKKNDYETYFNFFSTREIYWLIGKHSPLSLENKLLIYKAVLKPVLTYRIELWGCATKSNIALIQLYQSKLLRTTTNAPWYVSNQTLHSDLHIPHGIPGTDSYSLHDPGLAPQPSHGTTSAPAKQQRLKWRWTFYEIH
jgi:hypothetical protein